jgi:hypothetical protein
VQSATLKGFTFDGQLAGCNFNLTLVPLAPTLLHFRLILSSSVVNDDIERRFSCGATFVRPHGADRFTSTDLVLERVQLLAPIPLDAACIALVTDALREWFFTTLARKSEAELD